MKIAIGIIVLLLLSGCYKECTCYPDGKARYVGRSDSVNEVVMCINACNVGRVR